MLHTPSRTRLRRYPKTWSSDQEAGLHCPATRRKGLHPLVDGLSKALVADGGVSKSEISRMRGPGAELRNCGTSAFRTDRWTTPCTRLPVITSSTSSPARIARQRCNRSASLRFHRLASVTDSITLPLHQTEDDQLADRSVPPHPG